MTFEYEWNITFNDLRRGKVMGHWSNSRIQALLRNFNDIWQVLEYEFAFELPIERSFEQGQIMTSASANIYKERQTVVGRRTFNQSLLDRIVVLSKPLGATRSPHCHDASKLLTHHRSMIAEILKQVLALAIVGQLKGAVYHRGGRFQIVLGKPLRGAQE